MSRRYTAIVLIALMINMASGLSIFAQTQNDRDNESLRKIKIKVAKLFSERRGKVIVKHNDGTKIKGYITEVKEDSFSISESKNGTITAVQYPQVKSLNRDALPIAAKILITTAASLGIVIVLIAIAASSPGF